MAPNTSGIKLLDQIRSLQLVEMAFYHLDMFWYVSGNFVIKVFGSHDAQVFLKAQTLKNLTSWNPSQLEV